jgi:hypothetical protein
MEMSKYSISGCLAVIGSCARRGAQFAMNKFHFYIYASIQNSCNEPKQRTKIDENSFQSSLLPQSFPLRQVAKFEFSNDLRGLRNLIGLENRGSGDDSAFQKQDSAYHFKKEKPIPSRTLKRDLNKSKFKGLYA